MVLLLNGLLQCLVGLLGSLCLEYRCKVHYRFMTLGSGWAPWKTEWQGSSPSAALSSLLDWNFLAVEETHVLETKGQNLGMKSDFERSGAS